MAGGEGSSRMTLHLYKEANSTSNEMSSSTPPDKTMRVSVIELGRMKDFRPYFDPKDKISLRCNATLGGFGCRSLQRIEVKIRLDNRLSRLRESLDMTEPYLRFPGILMYSSQKWKLNDRDRSVYAAKRTVFILNLENPTY